MSILNRHPIVEHHLSALHISQSEASSKVKILFLCSKMFILYVVKQQNSIISIQ